MYWTGIFVFDYLFDTCMFDGTGQGSDSEELSSSLYFLYVANPESWLLTSFGR